MEPFPLIKKRIRNRKRKRYTRKKRLLKQLVFEVKSVKNQRSFLDDCNFSKEENNTILKTMEAKSFWSNYATAQKWQQTHNVMWWKTRCQALEQEIKVLHDALRILSQKQQCQCKSQKMRSIYNEVDCVRRSETSDYFQNVTQDHEDLEAADDDENLEFQVDEDMMNFLKQSIRHKMELRKQREEEMASEKEEEVVKDASLPGGTDWMKKRAENAKLLYGEASPRILGMETALQTTIDRHRRRNKPHYWPNIPLKL